MNRLTVAVALVVAGVLMVVALAVATLVVAAAVLPPVGVWGLAGSLALAVALVVAGGVGVDIDDVESRR